MQFKQVLCTQNKYYAMQTSAMQCKQVLCKANKYYAKQTSIV